MLRLVAPQVHVDEPTLHVLLDQRPAFDQVAPLLGNADPATVRAAVAYLGVNGGAGIAEVLATLLHHPDAGVVEIAEYGLWNIWMQRGSPAGNRRLATAVEMIRLRQFNSATGVLQSLVADEPSFAEAHHQLGLAHASLGHWIDAAAAYRDALRLNPQHFDAAAGLGHVCAEQCNPVGALHYYRRAQQIHPRLDGLADAIDTLAGGSRPRGDA